MIKDFGLVIETGFHLQNPVVVHGKGVTMYCNSMRGRMVYSIWKTIKDGIV